MPAEQRLYVLANGAHPTNPESGGREMKVRELIEILEDMDPDADVFVMSQESWPFECSVAGVAERGDWLEEDLEAEPWAGRDRWGASEAQLPANDVFIVEGSQIRYGAKAAWEAARR